MMRKIFQNLFICSLLSLPLMGNTQAATDLQLQAIQQLGELNGVALSCRHLEQTRRMKQAMVDNLPNERRLGEIFDQASNDVFLTFFNERRLCPVKSEFTARVDKEIKELIEQFAR